MAPAHHFRVGSLRRPRRHYSRSRMTFHAIARKTPPTCNTSALHRRHTLMGRHAPRPPPRVTPHFQLPPRHYHVLCACPSCQDPRRRRASRHLLSKLSCAVFDQVEEAYAAASDATTRSRTSCRCPTLTTAKISPVQEIKDQLAANARGHPTFQPREFTAHFCPGLEARVCATLLMTLIICDRSLCFAC